MTVFASCSKEDNGVGNGPAEGPAARMGMSFTLPQQAVSRALGYGDGDDVNASTAESAVKSVSVFVFQSGVAAQTGAATHFNNIATQFTEASGKYTLKSDYNIKTVSGASTVYIAVNLPAAMQKTYSNEAALKAVFGDVAAMSNATTGFTMISDAESVNLKTYDAADAAATTTTVTADVSRIVSKLVASSTAATYKATWTNGVELTYSIEAYNVYNEALDSYLIGQGTTKSTLNTFDASYLKGATAPANGNNPVALNPADLTALLAANTEYYIGENKQLPSQYQNTTYAFVATTVTTNKVAKWNSSTEVVDWETADYSSIKDVYVVSCKDGATYITNVEADATEIGTELNTLESDASFATVYTYKAGYVHFMVPLNKYADNDYRIGRNEFIHLNVTGIKTIDSVFPGYPGDEDDPEKPVDPTDKTPGVNPDPHDPTDPIDDEPAVLNVVITIKPWIYKDNSTILQ